MKHIFTSKEFHNNISPSKERSIEKTFYSIESIALTKWPNAKVPVPKLLTGDIFFPSILKDIKLYCALTSVVHLLI